MKKILLLCFIAISISSFFSITMAQDERTNPWVRTDTTLNYDGSINIDTLQGLGVKFRDVDSTYRYSVMYYKYVNDSTAFLLFEHFYKGDMVVDTIQLSSGTAIGGGGGTLFYIDETYFEFVEDTLKLIAMAQHIPTDTDNFTNFLSPSDDNVQKALETLGNAFTVDSTFINSDYFIIVDDTLHIADDFLTLINGKLNSSAFADSINNYNINKSFCSIYLETPSDTDRVILFRTMTDMIIDSVVAVKDNGTSLDFNISFDDSASAEGTNIFSSDVTVSSEDEGDVFDSVDNAEIPKNNWIVLSISSVTDSVVRLSITVYYTKD